VGVANFFQVGVANFFLYQSIGIDDTKTFQTEMYCSHQYPPIDPKKKFDTLNFTPTHYNAHKPPTTSKNRNYERGNRGETIKDRELGFQF